MPLTLAVAHIDDIPNITAAEWNAFENPLQPIFRLYCPVTNSNRAQSIARYAKELQEDLQEQHTNIENVWLKVVDSDSADEDVIVGGAQWLFVTQEITSIEQSVRSLSKRWPEGGAKMFASQAFRILREAEAKHKAGRSGQHSYATLGTFFTIPEYRKRGIGNMLMEWGLKRAGEKGLEAWIEAAPPAVPFYERHGFMPMETTHLDPERPFGLSEGEYAKWDDTAKSILPITAIVMCRPASINVSK